MKNKQRKLRAQWKGKGDVIWSFSWQKFERISIAHALPEFSLTISH
jgi:hypothetical protein